MGLFNMGLHANSGKISAAAAQQRIKSGESLILLDVRTSDEYRQKRINGAKLIPVNELADRALQELPDKAIPIIVYCYSGARAKTAAKMLTHMGYTDVVNLGGIIDWPYETVSG